MRGFSPPPTPVKSAEQQSVLMLHKTRELRTIGLFFYRAIGPSLKQVKRIWRDVQEPDFVLGARGFAQSPTKGPQSKPM
jgi:hypothetical protein